MIRGPGVVDLGARTAGLAGLCLRSGGSGSIGAKMSFCE